MDKLRVFQVATVSLLVMNILLVAFIFLAPKPPKNSPGEHPVEHLQLDEEQRKQFFQLVEVHKKKMRTSNAQQKELIQQYFAPITTDSAAVPGIEVAHILRVEEEKISSTYAHFLEVKELLRPDQMAHFDPFVHAALQRILLPRRKQRPGKKTKR